MVNKGINKRCNSIKILQKSEVSAQAGDVNFSGTAGCSLVHPIVDRTGFESHCTLLFLVFILVIFIVMIRVSFSLILSSLMVMVMFSFTLLCG